MSSYRGQSFESGLSNLGGVLRGGPRKVLAGQGDNEIRALVVRLQSFRAGTA